MHDSVIIGGGPAGVSAALTLRARGRSVLLVTGQTADIPLYRSERIANYPGVPDISGKELLERMENQALASGAELIRGHATAAMALGESFGAAVGTEFYEGRTLILCTGVRQGRTFPGEDEYLGRGVSYCVTCDGMLYRGRSAAVIGFTSDAEDEAETLRSMGCGVTLFTDRTARYEILGGDTVTALSVDGTEHPVSAVFILRPGSAPEKLLEGVETENGRIVTGRDMSTSIRGVFAAGDCTGAPYQIAKAVGEGNTAALSAAKYLDELTKE